jgi:hypothetical protein
MAVVAVSALAAGVLVATPQIVAPTAAEAAPATTLDPSNPIKLERFNYYTSVPTKFVRPVVLQKKVGNSWRTIFSGKTAATGKFRFTVHTGSNDTLRAFAAKTTYRGKTYGQVGTTPVTVRPLTQSAAVGVVSAGGSDVVTVSSTPARLGRGLTLQRQKGSSWAKVVTVKSDAQGRSTFKIPSGAASDQYRVVAAAWNGAPAVTSASAVAAPETTLDPSDPIKLERFNFFTSVPTQFVRPVVLQKLVGGSWKTIFSGNTAATGKFRFTVHTGSNDTLRAFAPVATYQGVRYGQTGTTPVTVKPLDQTVKLTLPKAAEASAEATATVSSTPARVGRKVELQVQDSKGAWSAAGTGVLNASGSASVKFTPKAEGSSTYRAVLGALNGAPALTSASSALTVGKATVKIPDKALLGCVDDALGKPAGTPITKDEAASVTMLFCTGPNDPDGLPADISGTISNLSGIEALTNLTSLFASGNQISDLAPLSNLKNVDTLYLGGNKITSLAPLANLNTLTLFVGNYNQISDLTGLGNLKNIDGLYVEGNKITSLTPLANLSTLTNVVVGHNQISDLRPLANLDSMTGLDISYNQVGDLTPLASLTGLQGLIASDNQIVDITPLSKMTEMNTLDLRNNKITDVAPLSAMKNLANGLQLTGNPVCTASPSTNGCAS